MSTESISRYQRAITAEDAAGGHPYLYPHPLTLARNHAEAERIRLADSAAYSTMYATWGQLGGLSTYYRYGPAYFRLLALRRWKITKADLASVRGFAKKSAACAGCVRRFPCRDLIELHEDNHDNLTYFHGDLLCRSCADKAEVIR